MTEGSALDKLYEGFRFFDRLRMTRSGFRFFARLRMTCSGFRFFDRLRMTRSGFRFFGRLRMSGDEVLAMTSSINLGFASSSQSGLC